MENSQSPSHSRLSLCGKIITLNCKRASGAHEAERGELVVGAFSFERPGGGFLRVAEGTAVVGRKSVGIVKCKCAADFQRRVTAACVLVTQRKAKGGSFKYTLLTLSSGSNRPEPRFDFKLPYELKGGDVSILQGPTVLWRHAGSVFYRSPQAADVRQIPAQLAHCVVGEFPSSKRHTFILGVQSEPPQSTSQTLGYLVQSGREVEFDGTAILPHHYISITRCILVLSAHKEADGVLKSTVVAATSNHQLLHFQNGIVKDVCVLPFEQPEDIQVVNTGRNGSLLVVNFRQGHVCAVWKETFQVASHWSSVSSVHVDDFLGCGTDQILLFFNDGSVTEQPLENVLITDLCGISYSCGQEPGASKRPSPPPESNLLTLQALESRLQSGLSVLQDLQGELRVKDRVVQQSVQALCDTVSEKIPVLTQPEQEGLVALWDSDDESKDEPSDEKMEDMMTASSKPRVDKLWHRIAEDRIVVGVTLTTESTVPVAGVSLSILTETGRSSTPAVIQTQSQVLLLPASSSSSASSSPSSTLLEPAAKRSKPHNASTSNELNTCRMAVMAVARLTPLLNSASVKCCVMLHYIQRRDALSFAGVPTTPVVLQCGQIVVDIHSEFQSQLLKNPTLKTEEVEEDFLCLFALLDRWDFQIDSPDQSLGDIDGWIQKREGCTRIDVSPRHLLLNSSIPSAVMLLHWHQINPFRGKLSVHSSEVQMLQFLDSLLAHLPVSCMVQPVKGARGQGAAQIFSLALEKEVASLQDCLSSLLSKEEGHEEEDEDMEVCVEAPQPTLLEGLQKCRDTWQRDVQRSRTRLSPLVDAGRYRQMTQSLCRVQLDGDLAALLETQRALLH